MWHKEKKKHEVEGETSGKEGVKSYVQVFARVPNYTWPTESPQPRAAQLRKKKLSPKDRRQTVTEHNPCQRENEEEKTDKIQWVR